MAQFNPSLDLPLLKLNLDAMDGTESTASESGSSQIPIGIGACYQPTAPGQLGSSSTDDPTRNVLSEPAKVWIESLDADLQPHQLAVQYPRVANLLAKCWSDRGASLDTLGQLVLDHRGGRQGFPMRVTLELTALRDSLLATRSRAK